MNNLRPAILLLTLVQLMSGANIEQANSVALDGDTVTAGKFEQFLARVNSASLDLRPEIVDSFMAVIPSFPYIENDTMVHFIYRGDASKVTVPGDANAWYVNAFPMTNIIGTNFWYYSANFESDARLEYKFVINGSNWIFDPRNPDRFNGVNSELKMPKYPAAPELKYYFGIQHGALRDTTFTSSILGNSRTIRVYIPPGYELISDSLAVIVVHDGRDWTTVGLACNVLDYLISRGLIRPVLAVFVPPVNRDAEYARDQQSEFASFICDELMPFIDARYRTCRDPKSRAVIGASAGSVISLYFGYHRPDVFGNVGALSGANQENRDSYLNGPVQALKIYAEAGKYEVPYYSDMAALLYILRSKGYTYEYDECHEGHSWGNWRTHLDDALKFFFGVEPSVPTVTTGIMAGIRPTTATLTGIVTPNGSPTTAWFDFGTDSSLISFDTTGGQSIGSGGSPVSVSVNLEGLQLNSTYYYRIVARNDSGTGKGTIMSFTTRSNRPPALFGLSLPLDGDTVRLTYPTRTVGFSWGMSSDPDGDEIRYTLTLKGTGIDTTFVGIEECPLWLDIMSLLERQSVYTWTVTATDGVVSVASADTFVFHTSKTVTGVKSDGSEIPEDYALGQNYPNPFNPSTTIDYRLPSYSRVTISLFDIGGREVRNIVDAWQGAGFYSLTLDASTLPSGIYFYRIIAGNFVSVKKMTLIK